MPAKHHHLLCKLHGLQENPVRRLERQTHTAQLVLLLTEPSARQLFAQLLAATLVFNMPRDTAQTRVRSGRLDSTTVTIDRPETEVRGQNGNLFTL
jgi:hypothetical protein